MSSFTILLPAHSLFYDLVCEGELKKRDTSLFSCSASKGFDTYPFIPHFGHSSWVAWITSNTERFQLDFLPSPDLTLLSISSSISRILRVVLNMQKKKDRKFLRFLFTCFKTYHNKTYTHPVQGSGCQRSETSKPINELSKIRDENNRREWIATL